MIFKVTIYDFHESHSTFENEEGMIDLRFEPRLKDGWLKFKVAIDYNYTQVTGYREYVLFDLEDNPIECTKAWLTDGSVLFAVNKLETFEKNLNEFKESLK